MDLVTAVRAGSTVLTFLIFIGIVWWAYGGRRKSRYERVAASVLTDDDSALILARKETQR